MDKKILWWLQICHWVSFVGGFIVCLVGWGFIDGGVLTQRIWLGILTIILGASIIFINYALVIEELQRSKVAQ